MMPRFSRSFRRCVCVSFVVIFLIFFGFTGTLYTLSSNLLNKMGADKTLNDFLLDETQAQKISHQLQSLPMEFWKKRQDDIYDMYYENETCAPFPNILRLKFNNIFWQTFKVENTTFQLYKAFYDTRKLNDLQTSVHILGMIDKTDFTSEIYCQFWFESKLDPVIVGTTMFKYIWIHEWGDPYPGDNGPYMITCQLPDSEESEPPSCVSLVEKKCDEASNILKVFYDVPEKKEEFAVCVKGLDFYEFDFSKRMVEWLEFLDLMGVHKVFMYKLQVHPNIEKVLKYYTALGRVDVTDITLPGNLPNLPFLQHQFLEDNVVQQCYNEVIHYNDCFYKNLYSYKYIVLLDTDEIIIPVKDKNWSELMRRVEAKCKSKDQVFASYNARNVYFLDDMTPEDLYNNVPSYMHMVKHTHRSYKFTDPFDYVKSFFDLEKVILLHNHLPLEHSDDVDTSYSIKVKHAQMNHYRRDCLRDLNCDEFRNKTVQDKTMWQFKDKMISRVNKVLRDLKFI